MRDILIKDAGVLAMDGGEFLPKASVLVSGGKIASITPAVPDAPDAEIIDGTGHIVMPGLVNAHTHLPMTLLRGYGGDVELDTWLGKYIFPAEAKLDERCIRCGTALAIAEALASGTTSLSDMYYFSDCIADEVSASGICANISRSIVDMDGTFSQNSASHAEMTALAEKWHGHDGGRILIDASIHAEYTSVPDTWEHVVRFAEKYKLRMHVHVSETKFEHEGCIERHGCTPVEILDRRGVFGIPAIAAHCVWLSDGDIAILARRGASAVHCPVSNLKLASGIARVPDMLKAGVNVALGTDGMASNNSFDMFEEIKLTATLHKAASFDPTVIPAYDALKMAASAGAEAQGRGNRTGCLRPGYDADLIMLDFRKPHLTPNTNTVSNLAYAARGGDVAMTMVRGRILYKNGGFKTLDVDKILSEVREYAVPKLLG